MLVKVEGTTFVRDTKTMALINTDVAGLEEYKMRSGMMTTQKREINNIKQDIDGLKDDVKVIKELLLQLASGK
jgi:hypothetical protein